MEDAHAHELTLGEEVDGKKTSFFAVYDGHGGKQSWWRTGTGPAQLGPRSN